MMTNNQCIPLFNALILLTSRVQFIVLLSAHSFQDPLLYVCLQMVPALTLVVKIVDKDIQAACNICHLLFHYI
ncbi:hypothetical protein BCR33DRAFT_401923 [Rhizoclosmatium globosum]|uniref:Uncharacterized protein n=1 Tax=Rhizoclosmatium globosum TaxID=329046 RepID=A0A1Y2CY04_9FUNG|nr:hypothetical protein BCR33DRAFT_401923 [Rhizoclosmatium globosum]|eukprot:ORY51922.1 hypothetical protein BCR33DRAFT_401923 [Rhizoclosmatium globosum]